MQPSRNLTNKLNETPFRHLADELNKIRVPSITEFPRQFIQPISRDSLTFRYTNAIRM